MPQSQAGTFALVVGLTFVACHNAPAGRPEPRLTGIGIVTGLDGTGAADATARRAVLQQLRADGMLLNVEDIATGSTALVRLSCARPPTATVGESTDVRCEAVDVRVSLRGGELLRAELRDEDGVTCAVASGPVVTTTATAVPGDAPRPAATTGWVLHGGVFVRQL